MMRLKPTMLSAVLVVALSGATQPADAPNDAPGAPASEEALEASASPEPEISAPAPDGAVAAQSTLDSAVHQTPETPSLPAGEVLPADAAAPGPSADAAAPVDKPAVPAKGKPPTREYFVGVWAEQGKSCETALDFKADGTLIGPFPRWELSEAGELTMVGNRQKIFLTVIDANTLQSRRAPNDPPRILKRCGG